MTTASDLWAGYSNLGTPAATVDASGVLTVSSTGAVNRWFRTYEAVGGSVGEVHFDAIADSGIGYAFGEWQSTNNTMGVQAISANEWRTYKMRVALPPAPVVANLTIGFGFWNGASGQIRVRRLHIDMPGIVVPPPAALANSNFKLELSSDGKALLGGDFSDGSTRRRLQVHGVGSGSTNITVGRYDAGSGGPLLSFMKSRGALGEATAVVSGDDIGVVQARPGNGSTFPMAGQVGFRCDGAVTANGDVPALFYADIVQDVGSVARPFEADAKGNVVTASRRSLATTATNGFLFIPRMEGAPTGAPGKAVANSSAMIHDAANNRLWIRSATGWMYAQLIAP